MADFHTNEKASNMAERQSPPAQGVQDQSFIQHESMSYEPPKQPVPEPGPVMVTPLARLGAQPADVDCPYCRTVRRTESRDVDSGDNDMTQCLICLVCWPMLFCYEGNKDHNHYCSVCKKQLTHQFHGTGPVQVVAVSNAQPAFVPSQFGTAS